MYFNGTIRKLLLSSVKCNNNKSVFSLINSAVNMALPTFPAERRAAALSIDIACPRGAQLQTRRTPQRLSNDGTDRQTDRRTDGRTDGHPTVT